MAVFKVFQQSVMKQLILITQVSKEYLQMPAFIKILNLYRQEQEDTEKVYNYMYHCCWCVFDI